MILFIVIGFFVVCAVLVMVAGFWALRPKVDFERLDEMERDVGIGPPYSSEFPKLRPQIKERIW